MIAQTQWTSRAAQAAADLGRAILAGDFAPGTAMPREAELAAEMGVSRNTLREAMKVLASKSLVEIAPRRGTVVLPQARWNVLDADVLDWSDVGLAGDTALVEELMETRAAIEPAAAEAAARHGTPERKEAVRRAWQAMAALAHSGDIGAKVETDLAWHVAVAVASDNRFLASIMGSIAHALGQHLRMLNDVAGNYEGNLANHLRVTEAILATDAQHARAAMQTLVAQARDDTRRMRPDRARHAAGGRSTRGRRP
jgi:DNA-binding FadR family transcriptional regulator